MLQAMRNVDTGEMALVTDGSGTDAIRARMDGCNCFHDLLFYHHQERPDRRTLVFREGVSREPRRQ